MSGEHMSALLSSKIQIEITGSNDSFRTSLGSQALFSFEGANWRQLERVSENKNCTLNDPFWLTNSPLHSPTEPLIMRDS